MDFNETAYDIYSHQRMDPTDIGDRQLTQNSDKTFSIDI